MPTKEDIHTEYKECKENNLPKSFWETVSSFANTEGGNIFLGVTDSGVISGLTNEQIDKFKKDIFNTNNNPAKISKPIINIQSISIQKGGKKSFLKIHIDEAEPFEKPIYLNGNPKHTYRRENDGDFMVTNDELKALFRNAIDNQDGIFLDEYDSSDLDLESIQRYKDVLYKRTNDEKYQQMSDEELLISSGAKRLDRKNGRKYKLTLGGLLFFGKYQSIIDYLPHFHLDFFNKSGGNERWNDRVSTGDLNYPNLNVFKYFLTVFEKMKLTIKEPFELKDNLTRKSSAQIEIALREALVNMLIHADYSQPAPNIVAEIYNGWYEFTNPGNMVITVEEFAKGGTTYPRNQVLLSLFRQAGYSDRAGTGGPKIFNVALSNNFKPPELERHTSYTKLKIWVVDFYTSEKDLNDEEKKVLRILTKGNKAYSRAELSKLTGHPDFKTRKILKKLMSKDIVIVIGKGKSTCYGLKITSAEGIAMLSMLLKNTQNSIINSKKHK